MELKTIYLLFVWALRELHLSKRVKETSKNVKVKIAHTGSHFCLFSYVPHVHVTHEKLRYMYVHTLHHTEILQVSNNSEIYTILCA